MKNDRLPFNKWSQERIAQGRKICTSRSRIYHDPRVKFIIMSIPLKLVKKYLWKEEGADSPEEFEKIWRSIHRGKFDPEKKVYTHFGNFKENVELSKKILKHITECEGCQRTIISHMKLNGELK